MPEPGSSLRATRGMDDAHVDLLLSGTIVTAVTGDVAHIQIGIDLLTLVSSAHTERLRAFLVHPAGAGGVQAWMGITTNLGQLAVLEPLPQGIRWHAHGGPCTEWFDGPAINDRLSLHDAVADQGLWVWDPSRDRMRLTRRSARLLGLPSPGGTVSLASVRARLSPADADRLHHGITRVLSGAWPHFAVELAIGEGPASSWCVRLDGRRAYLPSGQFGVAGRLRQPAGHMLDGGTQAPLLFGSPDTIVIFDMRGEILDLVFAPGELGWSASEARGVKDWSFDHPDDRHLVIEAMRRLVTRESTSESLVMRIARKDGAWIWHSCTGRTTKLPDGREVVVANHWNIDHLKRAELEIQQQRNNLDRIVTERTGELMRANALLRQREEQLVRGATLTALGTLVAGVIHEISAPLSTAELGVTVAARVSPQGTVHEVLDLAQTALRRALEVVAHLREAVRERPMSSFATVDLGGIIDSALALVRPSLERPGVQVLRSSPAQPDMAFVSPRQLIQALVNILLNAVHALPPEGGTIRITHSCTAGEHQLAISDTGCGMDEQVRRRVGEPFYTTHGESGALGLGISVTLGIVREHGGRLDFSSSAGAGTTVTLVLPHSNSAKQLP